MKKLLVILGLASLFGCDDHMVLTEYPYSYLYDRYYIDKPMIVREPPMIIHPMVAPPPAMRPYNPRHIPNTQPRRR